MAFRFLVKNKIECTPVSVVCHQQENCRVISCNKNLHVSDSSSVHHKQFLTAYTATVYVIQLASRIRTELQLHPDPAHKLSANLCDIHHCCV